MFKLRPFSGARRIYILATLLLVALLAGAAWYWDSQAPAVAQAPSAPPAIPVETAVAGKEDVPVYLMGLGTVQAYNTITVTTRVDGALQTIGFSEGQDVKEGDVLAQIDPRIYQAALDQAVATKAKDVAQLENAKLDLQRYTGLAPQNYTSKQIFDTQKALVAQVEAQVKIDQAAIDLAATNLDYTTIRAPIDGRLGIRLVDAGNNLLTTAGTGIVVLTEMHPISVIFTLPEDDLSSITKASAAGPLTVIALSRDGKTEFDRGTVAVVDNEILQATGTIRLKANFPNVEGALWPGQFVNAKLLVETRREVVTIPSPAVQRGPNGTYAYVVKPDSTVGMQPIKVGQLNDGRAIIEDGMQPGVRVVTVGQSRLGEGARVQFSQSSAPSTSTGQTAAVPGETR
jgi:multidrug efflux system membrane fusion protein